MVYLLSDSSTVTVGELQQEREDNTACVNEQVIAMTTELHPAGDLRRDHMNWGGGVG